MDGRFRRQGTRPARTGRIRIADRLVDQRRRQDQILPGTATYKTNFKLDKAPTDENILINLNDFVAMARVKVNGQDAGGVWTAPYELDITDFVKEGDNELEIEVVNTWVNRLIGDQNCPKHNARHGRRAARGQRIPAAKGRFDGPCRYRERYLRKIDGTLPDNRFGKKPGRTEVRPGFLMEHALRKPLAILPGTLVVNKIEPAARSRIAVHVKIHDIPSSCMLSLHLNSMFSDFPNSPSNERGIRISIRLPSTA